MGKRVLKTYEDYENRRREVWNTYFELLSNAYEPFLNYCLNCEGDSIETRRERLKEFNKEIEIKRLEAEKYWEENWVEIPISVQGEEGLRYVKELVKAYNEMPEEEQ